MLPTVVAREVHDSLVDYLRTTFRLRNTELERALFAFLERPDKGLFRGPYLDVRLPFRTSASGAGESGLTVLPRDIDARPPYAHQLRAWERLSSADGRTPQPTLVTTGTGSGKTECFVYPLLDHCLRARQRGEQGIKAIVLYPMNALATDQAVRFARQIAEDPRLTGAVSAGLYVGGPGTHGSSGDDFVIDQRAVLRESPPDILLTNYRMLDFLLMRPEDKKLWRFNEPDTLRYIVLDELHTYDGAQGSDVACLLRRLKARLAADAGNLCAVGTSATIGGEAAAVELRRFAGELFEQPFAPESIVAEDRQSLAETFPAPDEHVAVVQDPWSMLRGGELAAALRRGEDGSSEEHAAAQAALWLPGAAADPETVAEGLARHVFLRRLLEALAGRSGEKGPKSQASVLQYLSQGDSEFASLTDETKSLALSSFLTLLSYARKKGRPFLDVQVQIWIKELRGLVMKVQAGRYEFDWRDELGNERDVHWAPLVYCRECGIDGIGAIVREGHDALRVESRAVGEAYLMRKRQARFIRLNVPLKARDVLPHERTTMCPACLMIDGTGQPCRQHPEPVQRIPIVLVHRESPETKRFLPHCPSCGAEFALTMLGGRISSLSSVVVGRLFQSRHQDALPKLLAFTDSVQDASHRAGFFGGRTFRFNLRSAIAGALDAAGGEAELESFAERVLAHHARADGEARTIAAFLPSDLRELDEAVAFHAAGEEGVASIPPALVSAMRAVVIKRLSWEITREFGYGVHVGHSLEVSGIATLELDRDRMAQATDFALSALREESGLGLIDSEVSTTEVRHFLEGMCTRMRFRGGICHPLLDRYMQTGKRFMLAKRMNPVLSPFGRDSVLPRFLYRGIAHDIFDTLYSKPSAQGYIRDWVGRSLRVSITDSAIDRFLERVMDILVSTGLLRALESEGSLVYGLDPSALRVTSRVRRVRCTACTRTVLLPEATAERWAHQRCDRYKCLGFFTLDDVPSEPDYYEKLFRTGRVQRIFAREHTGLLEREVREPLERAFKEDDPKKRAPDAPNLLTCTPTLEMGINIGDLSAVMLCSVPPRPANYLQRVGRAGRRNGNALVSTMVRQHPHDLAFFEKPEAMLRGQVDPPGVFLQSPEMLLRQMTAHAFDHWARREPLVRELPKNVGALLAPGNRDGFPHCVYKHYAEHKADIATEFFALFPQLDPDVRRELEQHVTSDAVVSRVKRAYDDVADERARLRRERSVLERRREALEKDPQAALARVDETRPFEDVLREEQEAIGDAYRAIGRVLASLASKHVLSVLADAGVLPNYAFPEPGVTLQAVLRGRKADGDDKPSKTKHEYMRPASAAIREFAPFNTFYAEGHKVKVAQIALGTKSRPEIELWRLCPSCPYVEVVLDARAPAQSCPRCAEKRFADQGALQRVVPFRQAWSNMDRLDAITVDDTEEREERDYALVDLVDVGTQPEGALYVQTDELTFGYELVRQAIFRQLNFGDRTDTGPTLEVAGDKLAQQGFLVCAHCGRVQDPHDKQRREKKGAEHVPYCPTRAGKQKEELVRVLLSRTMRSEALRILLPTAGHDTTVLPTLRAAFALGFRKHFHGSADHLSSTVMTELATEGRRTFLVFYDAVPGGTGYLADLWKDKARFFGMLRAAHTELERCPCHDGCYRCLFHHRDNATRKYVSRRAALHWLGLILAQENALQPLDTLSKLRVENVGESELEKRFVDVLEKHVRAQPGGAMEAQSWQGRVEHRITLGERRWRLVPQVDLRQSDGVAIPSRPDFVLYAEGEKVLPLAIFCDGFRYHVYYDEGKSRLGDDVAKRRAISESRKFNVWSVTWRDLDAHAADAVVEVPSLITLREPNLENRLFACTFTADDGRFGVRDSMTLLLQYMADPSPGRWRGRATYALLSLLMRGAHAADGVARERALRSVQAATSVVPGSDAAAAYAHHGDVAHLHVRRSGGKATDLSVVLRLYDALAACARDDFEDGWRAFLHAYNVLQHFGPLELVSTQWLEWMDGPESTSMRPEAPKSTAPLSSEGEAVCRDFPEARVLVDALLVHGMPMPVEMEPVLEPGGAVALEALLHFPAQRVAIVQDLLESDIALWRARDYHPIDAEEAFRHPEQVIALLETQR